MNEHLRSLIVFQLELDQEQDKVGDFYFCAAISLDAAQSIEPHPEADFTNLRLAKLHRGSNLDFLMISRVLEEILMEHKE